jgi:hypothetical protein
MPAHPGVHAAAAGQDASVSLDESTAEGEHAPRKRGPVQQVQRQLERISALQKPKQRAVMDVIEALLAQQGRQRGEAR